MSADPLLGLSLRAPPSNLRAEQSLLGALMESNKTFNRASAFLKAEHFFDAINGHVFAAIAT